MMFWLAWWFMFVVGVSGIVAAAYQALGTDWPGIIAGSMGAVMLVLFCGMHLGIRLVRGPDTASARENGGMSGD